MGEVTAPRRRWYRWLRAIHLYGGLLCSSYLVVYGVSSLLFSHPIDRLQRAGPAREWRDTVAAPLDRTDPMAAARQVAREARLVGRIPGPPKWSAEDGFTFEVVRPGYRHAVHVSEDGVVSVSGHRLGVAAVLKGLHDARRYPDSLPLSLWWNFTHITVLVLLFSTMSGILIWTGRRRYTAIGWQMLAAGTVLLLVLISSLVA